MSIQLTEALQREYSTLFDTCDILPAKVAEVDAVAGKVAGNRKRYEAVGMPLGIPWYFIGAIHNMETSLRFTEHLHNGDPLTARTVHVPKNRPASGAPPFTWEESATDALRLEQLDTVQHWSIPEILFRLEKYNGFGYRTRHPEVLSPYLWSYSRHYIAGKYVEDGRFDPDAVSEQCGTAVILRRLAETGAVQFRPDERSMPVSQDSKAGFNNFSGPLIRYSEVIVSEPVRSLQRALNAMPGIFVLVDGIPGRRTSDAFHRVTGHYLHGDPRLQTTVAERS